MKTKKELIKVVILFTIITVVVSGIGFFVWKTQAAFKTQIRTLGGATATMKIASTTNNTGLVGYWNFDSCDAGKTCAPNVKDMTGREHGGTYVGNAATTASGKIRNGAVFDGSGDLINFSDSNDWTFGTGAFTVGFWIKFSGLTGYQTSIQLADGFNNPTGFTIGKHTSNGFYMYSNGAFRIQETGVPAVNTWYYITLVGNGGADGSRNVKLYKNGTQVGSTWTTNYNFTDNSLFIGSLDISADYLNGTLDDIRIYKGKEFSVTEIQNLYRDGLARVKKVKPVSNSGLVGYWNFDDCDATKDCSPDVKDMSGNNNNGTWGGTASTTASGKVGNGGSFGGAGYVNIDGVVANSIFNSAFTVSLWGKVTGNFGADQEYFGVGVAAAARYIFLGYRGSQSGDRITLEIYVGATVPRAESNISYLNDTNWHHIVGVRDSGNTIYLYIDGVLQTDTGVSVGTDTWAKTSLGNIWYSGAYTEYLTGSVDEVRIYNRALSASEIDALYRQGR